MQTPLSVPTAPISPSVTEDDSPVTAAEAEILQYLESLVNHECPIEGACPDCPYLGRLVAAFKAMLFSSDSCAKGAN